MGEEKARAEKQKESEKAEMRDRLKEILNEYDRTVDCDYCPKDQYNERCGNECLAAHLIANGVIVPPVGIGQTVWVYNQTTNNIYKNTVVCIKIAGTGRNANKISVKYTNQRGETSIRKFTWAQIGKQVFLTEEEAANALVERTKNENS